MINEAFSAVRIGDVEKLEVLFSNDPSLVNTENSDGLTLLGFAAHLGKVDTVKFLIAYGADVNAISHSKVDYIPSNSALHAAIAGMRELEVIKLLLKHNAKTNIFDSNGHTCLHTAAFHDDSIEIIKLLIENGADVNAKAEGGTDATSLAIENGNFRIVELLSQIS